MVRQLSNISRRRCPCLTRITTTTTSIQRQVRQPRLRRARWTFAQHRCCWCRPATEVAASAVLLLRIIIIRIESKWTKLLSLRPWTRHRLVWPTVTATTTVTTTTTTITTQLRPQHSPVRSRTWHKSTRQCIWTTRWTSPLTQTTPATTTTATYRHRQAPRRERSRTRL